MKKLLVLAIALSLSLPGAALAAKAKAPKKEAPKKWECSMGDKKVMTSSIDECLKMGGLVMNYPAPGKDAPKATKGKAKK